MITNNYAQYPLYLREEAIGSYAPSNQNLLQPGPSPQLPVDSLGSRRSPGFDSAILAGDRQGAVVRHSGPSPSSALGKAIHPAIS